ncbi:MAG: peptide-binding protein, partial [Thermodesulfatator sp.]
MRALVLVFLLFFGLPSLQAQDYGDALVIGTIGDASTLIPMLATDAASHEVASLIFNGLVKYDPYLNLVGDLAERYEVSPDGRTITFYLRKGVKWHDGVEFTAEDVLFGFRLITDPHTPTAYAGDFLEVDRAEVL